MKTVLCDDGRRREIFPVDRDGRKCPSVLTPAGVYPKPRAGVAPRGWKRDGEICGPTTDPAQWWRAR